MAPCFLQKPWSSGLQPISGIVTPFGRDQFPVWEEQGMHGAGLAIQPCWVFLGALSKKEPQQRYFRDAKRSLSSFSFLHSPFHGGLGGQAGRLVKGHLRLPFNETIHVQDRITCIKYTRLLIHLVIKQGITLAAISLR